MRRRRISVFLLCEVIALMLFWGAYHVPSRPNPAGWYFLFCAGLALTLTGFVQLRSARRLPGETGSEVWPPGIGPSGPVNGGHGHDWGHGDDGGGHDGGGGH